MGQSCLDINHIQNRWKNEEGYINSTYFYNAIKKYGWDNFEHIILEFEIEEKNIDEREQYWISYYHTWLDDPLCWGYNLQSGGNKNKHHSDITKEKMKQSALGRKMSPESIEKMKIAKIGKKPLHFTLIF